MLTVSNVSDSNPASLRQVLAAAPVDSSITFAPGLSGQTITLTGGKLNLSNSLTIDASALPGGIIINGNANSLIIQVNPGVTAELKSLTLTNGHSPGDGGALYNYGSVALFNCSLAGNQATSNGGGIINNGGTLALTACTISGSLATNVGGGVYSVGGTTNFTSSTFASNQVTAGTNGGGAFFNYFGTSTITACTFSTNSATTTAGGIWNFGGTLNLINSIVCSNSAPNDPNVSGGFTGGGNNLIDTNALLSPLGNYGGPTKTMPPLSRLPGH